MGRKNERQRQAFYSVLVLGDPKKPQGYTLVRRFYFDGGNVPYIIVRNGKYRVFWTGSVYQIDLREPDVN